MTTYNELLDMIIKRKEELRLKNYELAKIVYVNKNSMSKYLSGISVMPPDVLFATLAAIGYKVEVVECFQKS